MNERPLDEKAHAEHEAELAAAVGLATNGTARLMLGIHRIFPALYERNFRLYFYGQLVSLAGTWLQNVAQGWLVFQITKSAFWVGAVAALALIPTLVFALVGGVIIDHFDTRKILYVTQGAAMLLAFTLGALTILQIINLTELIILALALGTVNALDIPARQAFVSELVTKERLASAIALSSALTNAARAIGPAIAGVLIVTIGIGGTFMVNGGTFVAVIVALAYMRIASHAVERRTRHPLRMVKEGFGYIFSDPGLRLFMWLSFVIAVFGYSYTNLLPAVIENVFHADASALGYLYAAAGLGAFISALVISSTFQSLPQRGAIIFGNLLLGFAVTLFGLTSSFPVALLCIFCTGLAFTLEFSLINTIIQHTCEAGMRGRVMSVFMTMFFAGVPLGTFGLGYFGDLVGIHTAIMASGVVVLVVGAFLFVVRDSIPTVRHEPRPSG